MAPYDILERAADVRSRVTDRPRMSVTELSRSKEWRKTLPEVGVIEITDRGETAGWLLSPEDMQAIVEGYAYLEDRAEAAQIAAIFKAREGSKPLRGEALESAVRDGWETRKDELRSITDAG